MLVVAAATDIHAINFLILISQSGCFIDLN
jgi:hypothetical protein